MPELADIQQNKMPVTINQQQFQKQESINNIFSMKKSFKITSILILMCQFILAQKHPLTVMPFNEEGKICYSGVVEIKDKNQEKLYKDAKEYVLLNYTNREFPTILDETNERIYIKGTFKTKIRSYVFPFFTHSKPFDLVYTLKIYFKDGKYKYELTDLMYIRKINARIKGYYWGNGYGGGMINSQIQEAQVIKYTGERMYSVDRYRKYYSKLILLSDAGIKNELYNLEKFMHKDNNYKKDW